MSNTPFIGKPLHRKLLASAIADLIRAAQKDGLRQDEVFWACSAAANEVYFPDQGMYPFRPSSFPKVQ